MSGTWQLRDTMAFDRSGRVYDRDGHLRVDDNVFSAVGISVYLGWEIPGYDRLGLNPNMPYRLFRSAAELAKAAPTLAGKPILLAHQPISAADHPSSDVAGAVGNDVTFDGQTLRGSITVWTADAIAAIDDGTQRGLSCGYYYDPKMQSGTWLGQSYDGTMDKICFNHLALCPEPRVPGSMVGDAMPRWGVNGVTAMSGNTSETPIDPRRLITPQDDALTVLSKNLDGLRFEGKLTDDDVAKFDRLLDNIEVEMNRRERAAKSEMAGDKAPASAMRQWNALRAAERDCRPYLGEVVGDSAEEVYKLALQAEGIDLTGAPPSAYGAMVKMLPMRRGHGAVAMGAASGRSTEAANFYAKYPTASRLVPS